MKPAIEIIPVGRRWSYVVVISKRDYSVTIEGKSTYISQRGAMRVARSVGFDHL